MKHYNLIVCLLIGLIMCITMCCNRHHNSHISSTDIVVDSIDTIKMTPEESVNLMLDIRKEMVSSKHIDSVYMNMPEDIIMLIVYDNPDCDIAYVVKHYEEHKKYYEDILKQKETIEKLKEVKDSDSVKYEFTDTNNNVFIKKL